MSKTVKHEPVQLTGAALLDRWSSDDQTAAEVANLPFIDCRDIYEVTWPEHVLLPKFNGDCSIRKTEFRLTARGTRILPTEKMVQRMGDGSTVCSECWAKEYPQRPEPENGWEIAECSICKELEKE